MSIACTAQELTNPHFLVKIGKCELRSFLVRRAIKIPCNRSRQPITVPTTDRPFQQKAQASGNFFLMSHPNLYNSLPPPDFELSYPGPNIRELPKYHICSISQPQFRYPRNKKKCTVPTHDYCSIRRSSCSSCCCGGPTSGWSSRDARDATAAARSAISHYLLTIIYVFKLNYINKTIKCSFFYTYVMTSYRYQAQVS